MTIYKICDDSQQDFTDSVIHRISIIILSISKSRWPHVIIFQRHLRKYDKWYIIIYHHISIFFARTCFKGNPEKRNVFLFHAGLISQKMHLNISGNISEKIGNIYPLSIFDRNDQMIIRSSFRTADTVLFFFCIV